MTAEKYERTSMELRKLGALRSLLASPCGGQLRLVRKRTEPCNHLVGPKNQFQASVSDQQVGIMREEGLLSRDDRTTGEFEDFMEWADAMRKLREL